jgi:aldehyde:ferredoxin oxidoreductase
MAAHFGHTGFRLRVNLSEMSWRFEEIDDGYARTWMGGRGYNMETFFREIPPDADPRGPENLLMFGVGPLTGTAFPGSRVNVSGKSPHTGYLGDANAGGHFGPELKYAGIDQVVISGKAERPVYIRVVNHEVEIRDAAALWHLDTWDTNTAIRQECHDHTIQVVCCGTASVNGVSYGNLMANNARAFGRTGMGALMASKNLKALAVSGSGAVRVANPERFKDIVNYFYRALYNHSNFQERGITGTTNLIRLEQIAGIAPYRHFQNGVWDRWLDVSGETLAATYNVKRKACFGCIAPCSRYYVVPGGFAGEDLHAEGPEFETLSGFTVRVGNPDLKIALKCAELVNRAGVDSISVTECISWAQELYQRGLITQKDCDGLDLTWGNGMAVYELLQKIIRNEGFGKVLSQGVVHAAGTLGVGRELCMEVKNLEIFQADPRGLKAYGLGNGVASRGADHQRSDPFFEMSGRTADAKDKFGSEDCALMTPWKGKGRMVPWFEEICALADSLSFCKIIGVSMETVQEPMARDLFKYATGFDVDIEEVLRIGERINNLERCILARWGLSRKDDNLPKRFSEEPLPADSNMAAGLVFENDELLAEYYPFRGWDPETGLPTVQKLHELGLDAVAKDLADRGIALSATYARKPGDDNSDTGVRWAHLSARLGSSEAYLDDFKTAAEPVQPIPEGGSMLRRLHVDAELCTGCRACEMACSFFHCGEYSSARARVHVVKLEESGVDRPIVCLRCAKAPCVSICPVHAISQDPVSKVVTVDAELCVGCGQCAEVCVSGMIEYEEGTGVPLLCDLCDGRFECARHCPTGALVALDGGHRAAKNTRQKMGERTARQLAKTWNSQPRRPVDTPMTPPDPETGIPMSPPPAYGGNPPPPFDSKPATDA